jgi:Tol biopolymer transport system component
VTTDDPLFDDGDIDAATTDTGTTEVLEGIDDPTPSPEPTETVETPNGGEITTQAVLAGAKGFVVYIWNNPADATRPWRVYRHDTVADTTTFVYGGLRQVTSVATDGTGSTLVVAMKETTDVTSDFEVYQIILTPQTVTQLTTNTGNEANVSMSGNGNFYVWEGDGATAGIRNIFLRNNSVTPATTTALSPTTNQNQPSISNDGRYITLTRRAASNNDYVIYLYNRTANTYTLITRNANPIEHPSVSNYAEKLVWLQREPTRNRLLMRNLLTNVQTQIISVPEQLDHPHISADGLYLTYARQTGSVLNIYTRDLTTNQQVRAVASSVTNTAPYWQFPAPVTQLVGSPTSSAAAAVPRIEFTPRAQESSNLVWSIYFL